MADTASGSGAANDATVDTTTPVPTEDPKVALKARVDAAQARVDKAEAHLAGAKEALAEAKAALKEGI